MLKVISLSGHGSGSMKQVDMTLDLTLARMRPLLKKEMTSKEDVLA